MNGMLDSLIDERENATFDYIERGSVHILLCGHSTAHVKEIAERTSPIHIELLTSKELYDSSNDLLKELKIQSKSITVIPAFTNSALRDGIRAIIARFLTLKELFPDRRFYFGITGGTNLMVVEAALSALAVGADMHYILKEGHSGYNEGKVLLFNPHEIRSLMAETSKRSGTDASP
jgi:hypothetical protein